METGGHLHSGGEAMILHLNSAPPAAPICVSQAQYGNEGLVDGGQATETITGMSQCNKPIFVKAGDYLTMTSSYNSAAHSGGGGMGGHAEAGGEVDGHADGGHGGGGMGGEMAQWAIVFAPNAKEEGMQPAPGPTPVPASAAPATAPQAPAADDIGIGAGADLAAAPIPQRPAAAVAPVAAPLSTRPVTDPMAGSRCGGLNMCRPGMAPLAPVPAAQVDESQPHSHGAMKVALSAPRNAAPVAPVSVPLSTAPARDPMEGSRCGGLDMGRPGMSKPPYLRC